MKFITEEDLRYQYKSQPFTTYQLEAGTRLTPGATQFLSDKKVNVLLDDEASGFSGGKFVSEKFGGGKFGSGNCSNGNPSSGKSGSGDLGSRNPGNGSLGSENCSTQESGAENAGREMAKQQLRKKWALSRLKTVEARFLAAGEELLGQDVLLSQKVMVLAKQVSALKTAVSGDADYQAESGRLLPLLPLSLQPCTGIHEGNFNSEMPDCFEITEFHVLKEKGREIAILHELRCMLRETDVGVAERYLDTGREEDERLCRLASAALNPVLNTLSQMICIAFGGKTCQKKG